MLCFQMHFNSHSSASEVVDGVDMCVRQLLPTMYCALLGSCCTSRCSTRQSAPSSPTGMFLHAEGDRERGISR